MYKQILTAVTAIVLLCLPTAWAADTSATAAILMDGDTGEVLYEKNPDRQMLIASTTKLMTALVVLERGGLGDMVTVTRHHMAEGSSMYLKPGDRVVVKGLQKVRPGSKVRAVESADPNVQLPKAAKPEAPKTDGAKQK